MILSLDSDRDGDRNDDSDSDGRYRRITLQGFYLNSVETLLCTLLGDSTGPSVEFPSKLPRKRSKFLSEKNYVRHPLFPTS